MVAARFAAKVCRAPNSRPEGCWYWTGGIADNGYGQFAIAHHDIHAAHRLALAGRLGIDLPGDVWALHSCDEPSCFRPDHRRPGTAEDNRADTIQRGPVPTAFKADRRGARGRAVAIRTACRGHRTWTPAVIEPILAEGLPLQLF